MKSADFHRMMDDNFCQYQVERDNKNDDKLISIHLCWDYPTIESVSLLPADTDRLD